jgi:Zinc finger C-x8-C-x5-C-x3-H type (and similar)
MEDATAAMIRNVRQGASSSSGAAFVALSGSGTGSTISVARPTYKRQSANQGSQYEFMALVTLQPGPRDYILFNSKGHSKVVSMVGSEELRGKTYYVVASADVSDQGTIRKGFANAARQGSPNRQAETGALNQAACVVALLSKEDGENLFLDLELAKEMNAIIIIADPDPAGARSAIMARSLKAGSAGFKLMKPQFEQLVRQIGHKDAGISFQMLQGLDHSADLRARVAEVMPLGLGAERPDDKQLQAFATLIAGGPMTIGAAGRLFLAIGKGEEVGDMAAMMKSAFIFDSAAKAVNYGAFVQGHGAVALLNTVAATLPAGTEQAGKTAGLLSIAILREVAQGFRSVLVAGSPVPEPLIAEDVTSPKIQSWISEILARRFPFQFTEAETEMNKSSKKRDRQGEPMGGGSGGTGAGISVDKRFFCFEFMRGSCSFGADCKFKHDKNAPCPRGADCHFLKVGKCFHSVH